MTKRGASLVLIALAAACGEDPELVRPPANGSDAGDAAPSCEPDRTAKANQDDGVELGRGEYLVRHVAACGECHTPHRLDGTLDQSRWLAGVPDHADLEPDDPTRGAVHTPNLTPDATGLANHSDAEILAAFRDGIAPGGVVLTPEMPYYVFHNMTESDALEIVAYLRSIPPVFNLIPPRQPLSVPLTAPAQPIPVSFIPEPIVTGLDPACAERAHNGRYLAGMAAACAHCHTAPTPPGSPHAVELEKLLQGRRQLVPGHAGVMLKDPTIRILSRNLTPHENGTAEYTPQQLMMTLRQGTTANGLGVCPPMPSGPYGSYGGMKVDDAFDIGVYLMHLEPRDNGVVPYCCSSCHLRDE
jgi:hypothetical protein